MNLHYLMWCDVQMGADAYCRLDSIAAGSYEDFTTGHTADRRWGCRDVRVE